MAWMEEQLRAVTPSKITFPEQDGCSHKASWNGEVKEWNISAGKVIDRQKSTSIPPEIVIPGNRTTYTKGNSILWDTHNKVTLAKRVPSWPSQEGIEFKRELEGGHLPIEDVCQLTQQCLAPRHITMRLITAKLQSRYNENFQGGKDQAMVMLEAVHVGQPVGSDLTMRSQWSQSWGWYRNGPVGFAPRGKQVCDHWLESTSCFAVLPMPVFGIK